MIFSGVFALVFLAADYQITFRAKTATIREGAVMAACILLGFGLQAIAHAFHTRQLVVPLTLSSMLFTLIGIGVLLSTVARRAGNR